EAMTKSIGTDTGDNTLWIPGMLEIWDYLKNNKIFNYYIEEAHKGLEWITGSTNRVCYNDEALTDYRSGYYILKAQKQYITSEKPALLSFDEASQNNNSYQHNWLSKKVVCNSARTSRGPWRLTALFDRKGLAFSKNFTAFWLKTENNNIEQNLFHKLIAAILNSPVANAYMFDHNLDKHNRIEVFRRIPLPDFSQMDLTDFENTYNSLVSNLSEPVQDKNVVNALLLKIDALILAAYDLPPRLEKKLLDIFWGYQRPVPVEFTGYYPEGYASYTPLADFISESFKMSRGDKILTRYNPVKDPIISEILEWSRLADE
ncbi:MAG: hypothetical protein LWY06_15755, partial [Firmicutes bacterium]|nr:hypothetical protein [Bacillota bacterium]